MRLYYWKWLENYYFYAIFYSVKCICKWCMFFYCVFYIFFRLCLHVSLTCLIQWKVLTKDQWTGVCLGFMFHLLQKKCLMYISCLKWFIVISIMIKYHNCFIYLCVCIDMQTIICVWLFTYAHWSFPNRSLKVIILRGIHFLKYTFWSLTLLAKEVVFTFHSSSLSCRVHGELFDDLRNLHSLCLPLSRVCLESIT